MKKDYYFPAQKKKKKIPNNEVELTIKILKFQTHFKFRSLLFLRGASFNVNA